MLEFLLVVFVLSIPVCAYVALGLAIGARRRAADAQEQLRRRLRELTLRVEQFEALRTTPPPAPVREPPEPARDAEAPAPREPVRQRAPAPAPPERVRPAAPAPPEPPVVERLPTLAPVPEVRAKGPSLEEKIGGRWFNWVGILAILFGVAYAMKYSFEQGWITPMMRFWGGLLLGGLLLGAGGVSERRSYAVLARGFWGGGIGVLFVVFFAGFKLLFVDGEPILGRGVAFAGMAATVAIGVAIAIVYDTRTTAALSAIGGYLVPVLLRTGVPDQIFLFTYLLILTGGLLFLGYWKRWGFLRLLTFGVVVAYFAGWWITEGTGAPWAMLLYPSVLFLFFATEIAAWSVWRRVADAGTSYVVLGLVTTLHALSGLGVLHLHFTAFRGAFLLATAAYLLLGAWLIARRHPEDRPLALCYGYAGGLLLLLVPPLEARLHGPWHACGWAVEGALLFLASEAWGARGHGRFFAFAALGLGALRLLAYDTPVSLFDVRPYLPFSNARGLAYAIVTLSFVFGCWRSAGRERGEPERHAVTGLWITTLTLPAVLLSLELAQAMRTYVAPRFEGQAAAYDHQASHWMTLLWGAYATLVATVASRRRATVLRNVALLFGGYALVHFVVRGLAATYVTQATALLNSRFGVTAALSLCLFWCAREFRFLPARGAAHLYLLAGLGMEWVDLCHVRGLIEGRWIGAPWFGLTILIAAYGRALLRLGSPALRAMSLALVAAAAVKFLLFDLQFVASRMAPILQIRFAAGVVAAAACLTAAAHGSSTFLRVLGHLAIVVTLSADALDFARGREWANGEFAMTGLWAAYGLAALHLGHALSRAHLRALGLMLLWISLAACLILLPAGERAARVLLNVRCLGLGVTAAGLLLAAGIYRRTAPPAPPLRWSEFVEGPALGAPLSLAGHGLVMLLLTLEAADRFHLAGSEEHMRQLSYSLIWAVYAIGMVVAGLARRYRPVRLMALAVLVGTILKVFLFDLSFLENPYRILSFLALGAILVAVSFLYQKYRHVLA